jgi:hypothetical protein
MVRIHPKIEIHRDVISFGVKRRSPDASKKMYELTEADHIWNRACLDDVSALRAGDRALAAMILFHGLVMNGGVLHALECMEPEPQKFEAAMSGYRLFGFDHVADFLTVARSIAVVTLTDDDFDSLEAKLYGRYRGQVPDDSTLAERFEAYHREHPHEFAPLSPSAASR